MDGQVIIVKDEIQRGVYKGIYRSFQTELITKHMLTFVIGHCSLLQNNPLLSLCKGFSISAILASSYTTDFVESHVEWSLICPIFQSHLRNHKWPNLPSKEGDGEPSLCFNGQKFLLLVLVYEQPMHKLGRDLPHIQIIP